VGDHGLAGPGAAGEDDTLHFGNYLTARPRLGYAAGFGYDFPPFPKEIALESHSIGLE
jgi:hypothetical protein